MRSTGTSLSPLLRRNNCRLRKTGWEHATQKPQPSPASLRHSITPLPTPSNPAIASCCCSPSPAKRRPLQCIYQAQVSANTCISLQCKRKKKKSTQPSDKPPALREGRERGLLWQITACHPMQNKTHRMLPIIPHVNSWESNLRCRFPPFACNDLLSLPVCVSAAAVPAECAAPETRSRLLSLARSLSPSLSLARSLSLLAATRARNITTTQPPPTPFPKHIHTEETQPGEPDEPGRGWRESPASGLIAPVTFSKPLRKKGKKMNTERIPCLPSSSAGLLFSLQNTKRWTGRSDTSVRLTAGEENGTNNYH